MVLPVIARMAAAAAAKQIGKAGAKRASKEAAEQAAKAEAKSVDFMPGARRTGTRAAKDTKEPTEYTPEVSGRMRFRRQDEDVVPEDRTPRMSDDYKKGGKVKSSASKRADGIAQRGKTRA